MSRFVLDACRFRRHPFQLWMRLLDGFLQGNATRENIRAVQSLESVTNLGFDAAVETGVVREGSEEKAAGEGERFHAETA